MDETIEFVFFKPVEDIDVISAIAFVVAGIMIDGDEFDGWICIEYWRMGLVEIAESDEFDCLIGAIAMDETMRRRPNIINPDLHFSHPPFPA